LTDAIPTPAANVLPHPVQTIWFAVAPASAQVSTTFDGLMMGFPAQSGNAALEPAPTSAGLETADSATTANESTRRCNLIVPVSAKRSANPEALLLPKDFSQSNRRRRARAPNVGRHSMHLDAFLLAEIAKVTGLSLAACSRFRAGTRVPHPRHWEAFLALVEGAAS
jgi:hypothetical protein